MSRPTFRIFILASAGISSSSSLSSPNTAAADRVGLVFIGGARGTAGLGRPPSFSFIPLEPRSFIGTGEGFTGFGTTGSSLGPGGGGSLGGGAPDGGGGREGGCRGGGVIRGGGSGGGIPRGGGIGGGIPSGGGGLDGRPTGSGGGLTLSVCEYTTSSPHSLLLCEYTTSSSPSLLPS